MKYGRQECKHVTPYNFKDGTRHTIPTSGTPDRRVAGDFTIHTDCVELAPKSGSSTNGRQTYIEISKEDGMDAACLTIGLKLI